MTAATEDGARKASAVPHRRARAVLITLGLAMVALDQLTKAWALSALQPGQRTDLLGSLFGLRLVFNSGAALSFGAAFTGIITVIATVVVVVGTWWAWSLTSGWWITSMALLLGGAVGNLIDRLVRAPGIGRGHVIDFLDYGIFVGNVADIAIVGAGILVVILVWRGVPPRAADAA